jgi:rod shape-determining protein MreD
MTRPFGSVIFYLSMIVAYTLFFYPLRGELTHWRPMFVFITVTFWLLVEPHVIGVGFAWLAGFILDLLTGSPLGQNALAMAISAYLLQLVRQRIHNFQIPHQVLVVAVLGLFYQLVAVVVGLMAGKNADSWQMLYPVVSSSVLWPFIAVVLWKIYRTE